MRAESRRRGGFPGRGNSSRVSETGRGRGRINRTQCAVPEFGTEFATGEQLFTNTGPGSGRRGPGPSRAVGSGRTHVPLGPAAILGLGGFSR